MHKFINTLFSTILQRTTPFTIVFLIIFTTFYSKVNGQSCLTNSLIINTGYNPITGLAIAPGANGGPAITDPHWTVSSISPDVATAIANTPITGLVEVTPGNNADIVTKEYLWTANPPANPGGWISCLNANVYYDDGTGTATYYMTLSRSFRVCSNDSIKLSFYIANDNYCPSVNIDGSPLPFSQSSASPVTNFSTYTYCTQTVYLTSGTHIINVEVINLDNTPTPTPQDNWTGLNIYGTASSATGSNSLVSETSTACNAYVCTNVVDTACNMVSLPDTLHACAGSVNMLQGTVTGSDSILNIHWSPATGLSDTSILNPVLSVSASGWYHLAVESLIPENLVVNGNFSAGNTGFTSPSYTYLTTAPVSNDYTITTDEYLGDPGINIHFYDHTNPPTGNMMMVNGGSPAANTVAWQETVPVAAGDNYEFTTWYAYWTYDVSGASNPNLLVKITPIGGTGTSFSGTFTALTSANSWNRQRYTWSAPAGATSATIQIIDQNSAYYYNDFCLDDISFQPVCTATDSIYVAVIIPDTTYTHTDTTACLSASSVTLTAPSVYTSYLWSNGNTTNAINVTTTGNYWVSETHNCSSLIDTFHVINAITDTTYTHTDTAACLSASAITLTAPLVYTSYLWNNGNTTNAINVTTAGNYWVSETHNCSSLIDTFHVTNAITDTTYTHTDTTACLSASSITLAALSGYTSYLWSNGNTTNTINVATAGNYWVSETHNCNSLIDTFHVTSTIPDTTYTHTDTALCAAASNTMLTASPGYTSYLWNNGDTTATISITTTGSYWVNETYNCTSLVDTFHVIKFLSVVINVQGDTAVCKGSNAQLNASGAITYSWIPAASLSNASIANPVATLSLPTTYIVTGIDSNGCSGVDSITVNILPSPALEISSTGVVTCNNSVVQLTATGASEYSWQPAQYCNNANISDPLVSPVINTTFYLTAYSEEGCIATDSIQVPVSGEGSIMMPTAFTPNDDGKNDVIYPLTYCNFIFESFSIYNRWGQLVFFTTKYMAGWDGKWNGMPQPVGAFNYVVTGLHGPTQQHILYKGSFTLLR